MTIPSETFNNPMVPNPRIFWSEVLIPVEFKKSKKSEKHGEDTELCEDPPMKSVQNYLDPRLKAITVEDMSFSGSSLTRTRNHSRERLRHSFFSSTQASKTPFRLADVLRKEGTPERPLNHGFSYATSMHSASASYSTGKTLSDRAQLAGYAVEVFSASGLRRHVLGLFIEGTNFELWYFNRSGSYGSTPIPFGENFRNLIMFLLILGNASPAELGFEPFIHPPSTSDVTNSTRKLKRGEKEGFLRSADRAYFVIKGKTYVIRGERINRGRSIKGRGTMVWAVEEVKQHKAVTVVGGMVVKLSWQLSRRRSEVELLRFIREKGVTNVPEVFNHDDLDSLAAGAHGRVQPLVKEEQRRAADFDNRILRAIVLGPRLRPITSIPFGDFRAAYRDLVDSELQLTQNIHPTDLCRSLSLSPSRSLHQVSSSSSRYSP
ncbi:uncharacterized protein EI90DRAFT_41307 [Cantharellus anzutake]|uniref:uncharacterized protein n=1 Tax=Cantharellus anzutake TaxID=1750568 RepID=UPI0019050442|nr:uncharacterized protein EI90DRAFT_41307 [Cantharellus anzutake]KAF8344057.1 hypothetical protein EI90DRAFT_41307 [Cantharellus anzutake]